MSALDVLHSKNYYDPMDEEILSLQDKCLRLNNLFNATDASDVKTRQDLLTKMCLKVGKNIHVAGKIFSNFGCHFLSLGDDVTIGQNFTLVDETYITVGSNVFIDSDVTIACACHPENILMRKRGLQLNRPVFIEDDVHIEPKVIILASVTIGKGALVKAGSVVTHDVKPYEIVAGNPARVIGSTKKA